MLEADPVIFDMSNNSFSEMYMIKSINLLKMCSTNLMVLKLDGNPLNYGFLKMLQSFLKSQIALSETL